MIPKAYRIVLAVLLSVILLDQVSKFVVLRSALIPFYFNKTIAFSLPVPWFLPWMAIVIGLVIGGFVFPKWTHTQIIALQDALFEYPLLNYALAFMIGGGISNFIDRLLYRGRVVDFIDMKFWPVFNLADSFIVLGVILTLYSLYFSRRYHGK